MQALCFSHQKKRLSAGSLAVSFQNPEPQMFSWAMLFSEVKLELVPPRSWVMASIQLDSCGESHCFVIYKMSPVKPFSQCFWQRSIWNYGQSLTGEVVPGAQVLSEEIRMETKTGEKHPENSKCYPYAQECGAIHQNLPVVTSPKEKLSSHSEVSISSLVSVQNSQSWELETYLKPEVNTCCGEWLRDR
ncbi:hypothetical protein STEG23_023492, partial [Scotinomys teguina]